MGGKTGGWASRGCGSARWETYCYPRVLSLKGGGEGCGRVPISNLESQPERWLDERMGKTIAGTVCPRCCLLVQDGW